MKWSDEALKEMEGRFERRSIVDFSETVVTESLDNLQLDDFDFPVRVEIIKKPAFRSMLDMMWVEYRIYNAGSTELIHVINNN